MTKEEAIEFLEKLDYRFNKYGQLFFKSEDQEYNKSQYVESKSTDYLLDYSDGQFTAGYYSEVYYSSAPNEYKIFDFDPDGNVDNFETRRKY